MTATAAAVAFVVFSCKGKLQEEKGSSVLGKPVQVVDSVFMFQTENGVLKMRMEAPVMERYDNDSVSYELFPAGISAFAYQEDGKLETTIFADNARHVKKKGSDQDEVWQAYGNVVVRNEIQDETMETDTLYWDEVNEKLYTHCYVKMYSRDGFMQGYGMVSDQRANNSIILKPFNSYGIVQQDSTEVLIDSVNFIGPMPKK